MADARRLLAIFNARKLERHFTQQSFADDYDLHSHWVVWQYINGKIALNMPAALRFATGLGCDVRDFRPTIAEQLDGLSAVRRVAQMPPERRLTSDQRLLLTHFDRLGQGGRKLLLTIAAVIDGFPARTRGMVGANRLLDEGLPLNSKEGRNAH